MSRTAAPNTPSSAETSSSTSSPPTTTKPPTAPSSSSTSEALRACAALADDRFGELARELRAAALRLEAPPRVVLVGRVGVGKTTLVNRWAHTREPTGLGGVTLAPRAHRVDDVELVDTPGIDDPDRALDRLGALLDAADAVLWVVDGLQPITASERQVLAQGLPAGHTPQLIVARADLLAPEDRASVIERVRALAHLEVAPPALDLRTDPLPALPRGPTPWQAARARRTVHEALARLAALPPAPTLPELQRSFRRAVRGLVDELLTEIEAGTLAHKGRALQALRDRAPAIVADLPIPMPLPGPFDDGALAQLVAGLSGAEGAARVLKAEAARWLAEGQVVLAEGDPDAPSRHRRALRDALDDALHRFEPHANEAAP